MMKRDIDVIVVRGEFFRDEPKENGGTVTPAYTRNIMVQEYSGNMLFLQSDGGSLLNLQKEGEPFDLTEYIAKYVTEEVSHLVVNYVTLAKIEDVVNPFKIAEHWADKESSSLIRTVKRYSSTLQNNEPEGVHKKFNSIRGINDKAFVYMEIYVYYKEK